MKKQFILITGLICAVSLLSYLITTPPVQNLFYAGRRTGGADRAIGRYEIEGEDLTLKEPLFGGAFMSGRTIRLTGRITRRTGGISLDLTSGRNREPLVQEPGFFQKEVTLPAGSSYVELTLKDFTGSLRVESEACG